MNRILKIGMDVHSSNYTLCAIEPVLGEEEKILFTLKVAPDVKNVLLFINQVTMKLGISHEYSIECGYEAGCLGYSLYNKLTKAGIKCVILAPSTMLTQQGKCVKTDFRDALTIAKCLAYNTYHSVYIPTEEDDSVKEYIRMRDDHVHALKKIKQQISALCLRHDYHYDGNTWTVKHLNWISAIKLPALYRETLDEYLASYYDQIAKIERFDKRIEEISNQDRYREKAKQLQCLLGIKTHTAMSLIVETGDFKRFPKGNIYAAFLGLAPGEHSSGESIHRTGISKTGNTHLRTLITESAQALCRGKVGHKSKALKARQNGNSEDIIAYADKANTRLRSKYYRLIRKGKKRNVAVSAVARELACFVWGIMTGNIQSKTEKAIALLN